MAGRRYPRAQMRAYPRQRLHKHGARSARSTLTREGDAVAAAVAGQGVACAMRARCARREHGERACRRHCSTLCRAEQAGRCCSGRVKRRAKQQVSTPLSAPVPVIHEVKQQAVADNDQRQVEPPVNALEASLVRAATRAAEACGQVDSQIGLGIGPCALQNEAAVVVREGQPLPVGARQTGAVQRVCDVDARERVLTRGALYAEHLDARHRRIAGGDKSFEHDVQLRLIAAAGVDLLV